MRRKKLLAIKSKWSAGRAFPMFIADTWNAVLYGKDDCFNANIIANDVCFNAKAEKEEILL